MALRAAVSAAICAANGVLFLEPLKPLVPADPQARTLPFWSVMLTMVLLKVELIKTIPLDIFFLVFLTLRTVFLDAADAEVDIRYLFPCYFLVTTFLPATAIRFLLRRVRALVLVR